MRRSIVPGLLACVMVLGACAAPERGGDAEGAKAPVDTGAVTDLASLEWLAGRWRSEADGTEELWNPPQAGLMLGLSRAADGRPLEYMRIMQEPEGIVFAASKPDSSPVPFRLESAGPSRVVFANPAHDYPQRIHYWLEGETLRARIEGDTPEGAKSSEWVFRRIVD